MPPLHSLLLVGCLLALGVPLVAGQSGRGTYFPVTCAPLGNRTVQSLSGTRYCCSFTNPSPTRPINNYKFVTRNFAPLTLDTGNDKEITPDGTVDAYVAPRSSKTFCFVNSRAAGRPLFLAVTNPFPVVSISTSPSPFVALNCSAPPTFAPFDLGWGNGRDVLVTFNCTIRSFLTSFVSSIIFNCYIPSQEGIILTSNFNPDCTYQGYLTPAAPRDRFSFSVLAPSPGNALRVQLSVQTVAPLPQLRCIIPYNSIPTPAANRSTLYSNPASCAAGLPVSCPGSFLQNTTDYLSNAVVFRLPVNTARDRCLKVSTIPATGGRGYDTVVYVSSLSGAERTYLQCNDDIPGGAGGSTVFFNQTRNTQYDIIVTGWAASSVGSFPFIVTAANPLDCSTPMDSPPPPWEPFPPFVVDSPVTP